MDRKMKLLFVALLCMAVISMKILEYSMTQPGIAGAGLFILNFFVVGIIFLYIWDKFASSRQIPADAGLGALEIGAVYRLHEGGYVAHGRYVALLEKINGDGKKHYRILAIEPPELFVRTQGETGKPMYEAYKEWAHTRHPEGVNVRLPHASA